MFTWRGEAIRRAEEMAVFGPSVSIGAENVLGGVSGVWLQWKWACAEDPFAP